MRSSQVGSTVGSMVGSEKVNLKFRLKINQQVEIGTLSFNHTDQVSKITVDLKAIKVLGSSINQREIKYFYDQEQLSGDSYFSNFIFSENEVNLIRMKIPENVANPEEMKKKFEEFYRNKIKSKKQKQQILQARHLMGNLDIIFENILCKNYKFIDDFPNIESSRKAILKLINQIKSLHAVNDAYRLICEQSIKDRKSINIHNVIGDISGQAKQTIEYIIEKFNQKYQQEKLNQIQIEAYVRANQLYKTQLQHNEHIIAQLQQQITSYGQQIEVLQLEIHQLKNRIIKYNKQAEDLLIENRNLEGNLKKARIKIQQSQQKFAENRHIFNNYTCFTDKSLLVNEIAFEKKYSDLFMSEIKKNTNSEVTGCKLLYSSSNLGMKDFHKCVDFKDNILLIAKTEEGRLLGVFSSLPFDPYKRKHSAANILNNVKSFLFNVDKAGINFFPIKKGYESIQYEQEYIIFGKQQICIGKSKGKIEIQSLFVSEKQSYLHYTDPYSRRTTFLSQEQSQRMFLQTFECYQVQIK